MYQICIKNFATALAALLTRCRAARTGARSFVISVEELRRCAAVYLGRGLLCRARDGETRQRHLLGVDEGGKPGLRVVADLTCAQRSSVGEVSKLYLARCIHGHIREIPNQWHYKTIFARPKIYIRERSRQLDPDDFLLVSMENQSIQNLRRHAWSEFCHLKKFCVCLASCSSSLISQTCISRNLSSILFSILNL